MFKKFLRKLYRSIPFKRPLLLTIRDLGFGRLFSKKLRSYLVFEGAFLVFVGDKSFQMLNGYGREIEAAVFWGGLDKFEGETIRLWELLSLRSKVIIDVGANTGIYSLLAQAVNPKAIIHAFEPISRVNSILTQNINLNQSLSSLPIQAHALALSDYSGEGLMYDLPVEHMYTASLNKDIHAERGNTMQACTEAVMVSRLDDFLRSQNIEGLDLIKVDVESHEPEVLRGAGNYIERFHPSLIVEIWNNEVGLAVEEVLRGHEYLYFAITQTGADLLPSIRNEFPDLGYINYLIVTRDIASEIGLLG